ncbi:MAG: O-antigen ligase family protein [Candidatus Magasanikbacteria bacterium]|nr:O-antigen ligase family protein [Candidatus Magasanikbacteria bacterium]
MLINIIHYLLLLFLFLLPWQSRLVYQAATLNGGFWEYGGSSWYATEVLLWTIIVLSFISILRRRKEWQNAKSKKVYLFISLLVIGYFVIEIFHSLNADISFNFVFRLIGATCLVVIVLINQSTNKLITSLWLGGVVQGLLAIWQFFSQKIIHLPFSGIASHLSQDLGAFVIEAGDERWLRAYGAFGSPNILGGFLAITFLFGLLLYLGIQDKRYKIALTVGEIIIGLGLLFSFSRAAWIAVEVGIALTIILLWKNKVGFKKILAPLLISAGAALVAASFFLPLFTTRLTSQGRLEQQSRTTRVEQYQDFKTIFWSPLLTKEGVGGGLPRLGRALFGVGPGAYTLALYKNNPTLPVWRYQPIHNIYLLILAELGILGFIGVAVLMCCAVVLTWKHNRLFFPILISLFILGLFDHWLWSMYVGQMVCWLMIGLGLKQKPAVTSISQT